MAVVLAAGLLPAASGGAACLAHWGTADAAAHEAHGHVAHHAVVAQPIEVHAAAEHDVHAHHAPEPTADASAAGESDAPPASHDEPPCTALATCGALVTPERAVAPVRVAAAATARVLQSAERPVGPHAGPDVPPPRA